MSLLFIPAMVLFAADSYSSDGEPVYHLSETDNSLSFVRRFAWEPAQFAIQYTLILEQKRENMNVYVEVLRRNTDQTYLNISIPPGEYRYRVVGYNILGLFDSQSEWDYFVIRNPITLMLPATGVSLGINPQSPPPVAWSTNVPLRNTRVIFSREPDPSQDARAIVQSVGSGVTTISLPSLNEGVWYWIVQGETPDGHSISPAEPFWFTLLSQPPLASPKYVTPGYNELISLDKLMADRKITFKWEQVPGANAYIFTLFGNTEKQELLFSSSPSPETAFELTDLALLTLDNYNWQVEAVSVTRNGTIDRRGVIQQYSFTLDILRSNTLRTRSQGSMYGN